MKTTIDVKDRHEATAMKTAMDDPAVKAFVVIVGTLMQLPTDRARKRVMQYVADRIDEESETGIPQIGG